MKIFAGVLSTAALALVLSSCDGQVATVVVNEMIDLTLYYGQQIAQSVAAKSVEALLDQVFAGKQPAQQHKITIDPNDTNHAVADRLVLHKEDPPCDVTQDRVSLTWDEAAGKWQPDASFLRKAQAVCAMKL